MGKNLSAEELWSTIESSHSVDNRFGDSFAITLDNGYTYIYKALPDGKLLSIDEWFEGYVSILGTAESGLLYAVKYEKTNICFYEYADGVLQSSPTVSLKSSKKKMDELKSYTTVCPPIRITLDYNYKGSQYWVIETYGISAIVYNVTEQCIHEKYKNEFYNENTNGAVIYRLPFAPYKYGLVTEKLPYSYLDNNHVYIIDFVHNVKFQLLDYCYKCMQIYEYGDNEFGIFALKKHVPVAYFKYDEVTNSLETYAYYNDSRGPHSKKGNSKLGKLIIPKCLIDKNDSGTDYVVEYTNIQLKFQLIKNVIVVDQQYLGERISGSYTITDIVSSTTKEVCLVKEFVDFLKDCYTSHDVMSLDYTPTELMDLCAACDECDSIRLKNFLNSVCSRLRTRKIIISESKVRIGIFVHELSFGNLIYRRVNASKYNSYEKLNVGFYKNCKFTISITLSFNYSNEEELRIKEENKKNWEENSQSLYDNASIENWFDDYDVPMAPNPYRSVYDNLIMPN